MLSRRRAIHLTLVVFATTALASLGACRKKGGDARDAEAEADASSAAADASAALDDSGATGAATAIASAEPAEASIATEIPPTSFAGSYRCFKGMQLQQSGTIVTSTMHTNGTTDTVIACNVGRDDCVGTVREIQTVRGKAPKVLHVRPVTLHRTPNGDVLVKVEPSTSGAHDTKPSTTAPTLCPRR
ncbi:MAG: hypothetical protein JWP87_3870 [Labilithrix sp.]|nr:hypothetical protein [Labilithrix sp.]